MPLSLLVTVPRRLTLGAVGKTSRSKGHLLLICGPGSTQAPFTFEIIQRQLEVEPQHSERKGNKYTMLFSVLRDQDDMITHVTEALSKIGSPFDIQTVSYTCHVIECHGTLQSTRTQDMKQSSVNLHYANIFIYFFPSHSFMMGSLSLYNIDTPFCAQLRF